MNIDIFTYKHRVSTYNARARGSKREHSAFRTQTLKHLEFSNDEKDILNKPNRIKTFICFFW